MCVLIVTDFPGQTEKLRMELKERGILSKTTETRKVGKTWLTQFSIIYIHPLIKEDSYETTLRKIRKINWQIPMLIPYEPESEIPNTFKLPQQITPPEIALTIQALINRHKNKNIEKLKYKDLEIDPGKRIAKRRNKITKLRNKEFGILEIMIRNAEKIITKNDFTDILWDRNTTLLSNTLESHMSNLRKKIDKGFPKKLIHTIPYAGYKLGYED